MDEVESTVRHLLAASGLGSLGDAEVKKFVAIYPTLRRQLDEYYDPRWASAHPALVFRPDGERA